MSIRVYFNRTTPIVVTKLQDELTAAGIILEGISNAVANSQQVGVDFVTPPTTTEQITVQSVIAVHDGIDNEAIQQSADFADYQAMVESMITAADAHLNDITTDETGLAALLGLPTLVQYKQQWARAYTRERAQVIGMKRVLAALKHLTPTGE